MLGVHVGAQVKGVGWVLGSEGSLLEMMPGSRRLLAAQPCHWPMEVTAASSLPGSGITCLTHEAKAISFNLLRKSMRRET